VGRGDRQRGEIKQLGNTRSSGKMEGRYKTKKKGLRNGAEAGGGGEMHRQGEGTIHGLRLCIKEKGSKKNLVRKAREKSEEE